MERHAEGIIGDKETLSHGEKGKGKIGRVMSPIVSRILWLIRGVLDILDQIQSSVIEVDIIIQPSIVDMLSDSMQKSVMLAVQQSNLGKAPYAEKAPTSTPILNAR